MSRARVTVRPHEICGGYYVAFGTDLGNVGFFMVLPLAGRADNLPYTVWGLSRWRGVVAYRTRGMRLDKWLALQPLGAQYRKDFDRTGWSKEK